MRVGFRMCLGKEKKKGKKRKKEDSPFFLYHVLVLVKDEKRICLVTVVVY